MSDIPLATSEIAPDSSSGKFDVAVAALKTRCDGKLEVVDRPAADPVDGRYISVIFPNGHGKRRVDVSTIRRMERLLNERFEALTFLGEYEAVCDYQADSIEAYIRPLRPGAFQSEALLTRLYGKAPDGAAKKVLELFSPNPQAPAKIVIGPMTTLLKVVLQNPRLRELFGMSIKFTGFGIKTHDQAVSLLERAASSIFLQIDLQLALPLMLAKIAAATSSRFATASTTGLATITFPTSEYDTEPTMLYFYGRSSLGLPLLQFLAFYQVLEFYFPKFSQIEARKRASAILKTPGFDCHRETDVVKLVMSLSRLTTKGFGEERAQLRATIAEIVTDDELKSFYNQSDEFIQFFTKSKETTSHRIPTGPAEHDLRSITADRIYDIRCKIVHSKSDAGGDTYILPFSKQAAQLYPDIALLTLLAQKALINGSTAFQK